MLDTHRDTLRHLVALYERDRSQHQPSHTPQATSSYRELFVEPWLAMLGWRVPPQLGELTLAPWPMDAGLPPAYLCTCQGARRFMLATTPPGLDIDADPAPARLLRRRAWSAHLPLAVLTNVETIAVYDTRVRPNPEDGPHVGRRLHVPWEEITQRWEELAVVLSRAAVMSGKFDAYAYAPGKRGIGVKQAFLADVARWRELLGVPFAQAQAVLDGVIFLAMAQARGAHGRLVAPIEGAAEADADIRATLLKALVQATQASGAALFAGARSHLMDVDEPGLRAVTLHLFEDPHYDLAWMPDDILGQTYEASLAHGKGARGALQTRKSGGVYYTPAPVVRHIVKHVMRRLGQNNASGRGASIGDGVLRILDPACGAGAFLVEVYRALLDATLTRYLSSDPLENPRLVAVSPGVWQLTLAEKFRLLTSHVFGVDIDPEAVAVTKRALLLVALSGEPCHEPRGPHFGAACALPCLDNNIKCGNMLVAPDFGASNASITAAERAATRPFDWRKAFPSAAFAGGFDAVVGNPPYGVVFSDAQRAYIKTRFAHQGYRADSYLLFVELCLAELVRAEGFCGLVIPNPWLTNVKQRPLRTFVLQHAAIEQIVHVGCAMFKSKAVVDTQIVLMRRQTPHDNHVHTHWVHACDPSGCLDLASATTLLHEQAQWLAQGDAPINIFVDDTRRALAAKIKAQGPQVSTLLQVSVGMKPYQVGKGKPKQTPEMVQNRVFDADTQVDDAYRRYLRGADIRRFAVTPVRERFVRYGPWLAEPRVAANFDAPAKLLLRQTSDHLVAAIDYEQRICMNNLHVLTPRDTEMTLDGFLGVFNSRLMNWYYQIINPERGEALAEVKKHHVESLPMPQNEDALAVVGAGAREMARLTEAYLASAEGSAARQDAEAMLAAARAQVDEMVYALFELDAEQIAIIVSDAVD